MALNSLSCKCFNAVETALEAVKSGDAHRSVVALQSVQKDGLLLQNRAAILIDQLSKAEKEHQQKVDDITRQMNELYSEETQLASRKQALDNKKSSLADQKQRYYQNKEEASRKYEAAKREKRNAEREYDKMKGFFWIPIFGWILALIEEHSKNASDAQREMMRYERDVEQADNEIRWVDSQISQIENDLKKISSTVEKLRKEREACHEKLGDIKNMTSFIMQAVAFWDEVVAVTKQATIKTEHLERIVSLAGRKTNPVRILRSGGTQTMVSSFKDRWMEVAEMITSDRNNVIFEEVNALM